MWALSLGIPGIGGSGNPVGNGGCVLEPDLHFGAAGSGGGSQGPAGTLLGTDPNRDFCADDGAACDDTTTTSSCTGIGATRYSYLKIVKGFATTGKEIIAESELTETVLAENAFSGAPTVILYDFRLTETFLIAITDTTSGETQFRDSTSTITFNGTNATQEYQEISGFLQNMSFARQPHCDRDGNLQWPGEGLHRRNLTSDGILYMEWELKGCISFFSENDQHGRENATCCEHPANSGNYVLCSQ